LTDELSDLRHRYAELSSLRQGTEGMSMKMARDLGDKVQSYGTRVEALRAQRDRLMAGDTQLAHISVADGADIKLQKLWIDLRRLVRFIKCCLQANALL
jgi:hypothetical protein